ncbi:MAG: hypothetical protein KBS85_06635 [Lachnospiraceae bacterium]|nr:hypothetical protein [Candidatus Merdinaster equi]
MIGTHYVGIQGKQLSEFSYYIGGDMLGSFYEESVKKVDDSQAIITISKAESHNQELQKKEYRVDISVLTELESIIRKNHMNFWNRKKFTNMFIADGASKGYRFVFENKTIGFSSQIYPQRYLRKLQKLNSIINEYIKEE